MSNHLSPTGRLRPIKKPRRGGPSRNPRGSHIYTLNDDILLNIFYLYRLHIKDEEDGENVRFRWDRQRWWYRLAQVSRKWRHVILASPIRLDIHLLCTYGVPIAEMLAHSPSLPLTIWYINDDREMTAEDEEGALLALSHQERVHRVALWMPAPNLCKFITAMDEEYPILERICIGSRPKDSASPKFPGTFQAPNLRHVWTTWRPIGSPLLTTTVGLVNLELMDIPPSPWFPPTYILTQLSLMHHLETVRIQFCTPHPNRDVETSTMMDVTLPNLHVFSFRGVSSYLEGLARIRAPTLSILDIQFFNQLTFSVSRFLQFMQASENLSFSAVKLTFDSDFLDLMTVPDQTWSQCPLHLRIMCRQLDWQVASAVQILDTLSPVLSGVEELTLSYVKDRRPSGLHDEVDRTQWRKLLKPFSNVKSLCVPNSLSEGLSHSLRSEDGETSLEIFPKLMCLQHLGGNRVRNVFTPFINERRAAGHSMHLVPSSSYISWKQLWWQLQLREEAQRQRRQQQEQQQYLQEQQKQLQEQQKQLRKQQKQLRGQQKQLQKQQLQRRQRLWEQLERLWRQQHPDGESMHGSIMNLSRRQQLILVPRLLHTQITQGLMTLQQAGECLAMLLDSAAVPLRSGPQYMPSTFPSGGTAGHPTQQQITALSQHSQASVANQMNPLQRVVQAQHRPNDRPLNSRPTRSQQPPNSRTSFTPRTRNVFYDSVLGFPQGQGSRQQNLRRPHPSVHSARLQSYSPLSSQAPSQGGQQMLSLNDLADAPMSRLVNTFNQLASSVTLGEKTLHISSSLGGPDPRRRAKLDSRKRMLRHIQEIIIAKGGRSK